VVLLGRVSSNEYLQGQQDGMVPCSARSQAAAVVEIATQAVASLVQRSPRTTMMHQKTTEKGRRETRLRLQTGWASKVGDSAALWPLPWAVPLP
jgi:hypothetical protein